jgi:hypothetical protein
MIKPSLVFCFLDNFVIILESVLIDHMLPILTKVNYAVNSQKLWKIHQNCSNKFIIIQSFFSSLLLFLKVKIGKKSMFSDFNENWCLGLFWSEEFIGNDKNCIQGHFYFQNGRRQNRQNFSILWFQLSIIIKIGDHWQFFDFVGGHFGNGGIVKMTLNAIFIITNQFLTSK